MTFYDRWLDLWNEAEEERRNARKVIHYEELEWVETPQDQRTALMVSRETGFRTWGSETTVAEIASEHHTGLHRHGEEVIHILEGSGFTIVEDIAYPWYEGSTLAIPFGAAHQHFNTGSGKARYLSYTSIALEHFVGLHRTEQLERWGATDRLPTTPRSDDGRTTEGRRIALNPENAEFIDGSVEAASQFDVYQGGGPLVLGTVDGMERFAASHHAATHRIMNIMKPGFNDFWVHEQEMSSVFTDDAHDIGGRHAHMEALLYVLEGEGYTEIDGEAFEWHTGSTVQVPGPQSVHQHFNTSEKPSRLLRLAPGIRYYFEPFAQATFPYLYFESRGAVSRVGQS